MQISRMFPVIGASFQVITLSKQGFTEMHMQVSLSPLSAKNAHADFEEFLSIPNGLSSAPRTQDRSFRARRALHIYFVR